MPAVYNVKNTDKPKDAVFIGRGSKWGNPFRIGRDGNRYEVIAKFENWIMTNRSLLREVIQLKGKDLVCFCAPKPCHGDILLKLANPEEEEF